VLCSSSAAALLFAVHNALHNKALAAERATPEERLSVRQSH